MKKIMFSVVALLCSLSAYADPWSLSNLYVDGFVGVNFVEKTDADFDVGVAAGGALGYRLNRSVRVEGEVAFRRNPYRISESGSYRTISAMGNLLVDLPFPDSLGSLPICPYVGVGLGHRWDHASIDIELVEDAARFRGNDHRFAYQGIVGIVVGRGAGIEGAIEYRFLASRRLYDNHTLALNLKRYF